MQTRQILFRAGSVALGVLFLVAAFVWWTVGGISAAMDTLDGEPSGPLQGYGVLAVLIMAGLALLFLGGGIRGLGQGRTHPS